MTNSKEFEQLTALSSRIRARIAAVALDAPSFGPIHGDIHQGNCHFSADGGLTVFDFALCGVGFRAYDLTGFLWPMRDSTIEDQAMSRCCNAFLAGYCDVRPLSQDESMAISAFVQVRTLWELGDWIETGTGRDEPDKVRNAVQHIVRQFAGFNPVGL